MEATTPTYSWESATISHAATSTKPAAARSKQRESTVRSVVLAHSSSCFLHCFSRCCWIAFPTSVRVKAYIPSRMPHSQRIKYNGIQKMMPAWINKSVRSWGVFIAMLLSVECDIFITCAINISHFVCIVNRQIGEWLSWKPSDTVMQHQSMPFGGN